MAAGDSALPLRVAGFLTGMTIHVEGDAGDFRFSGQLDLRPHIITDTINADDSPLPTPSLRGHHEVDTTPSSPQEVINDGHRDDEPSTPGFLRHFTRLRSGAIARVDYYSRARDYKQQHSSPSEPQVVSKPRRRREERHAMERLLRRRSLPVRPLNSYGFFVMAKWGVAKCGGFEETNKRVGEMWHRLSPRDKHEYVEMALKDRARYKKQYAQLRKH